MKEGQEWKNLNKEDQKTEKKGKGQMKRQTKMKKERNGGQNREEIQESRKKVVGRKSR